MREIAQLTDNWGEGGELAPTAATFEIALQLESDIRDFIVRKGRPLIYPELVPGVRGQIELEYSRVTDDGLHKDLFVLVPRDPQSEDTLILMGVKNQLREVEDVRTVSIKLGDGVDRYVEWFLNA